MLSRDVVIVILHHPIPSSFTFNHFNHTMSEPAPVATSSGEHLEGLDIAKIMSSQGPIVKCVLLRVGADAPSSSSLSCNNDSSQKDASSLSIKEIKRELSRYGVDTATFVEKGEMVAVLEKARRSDPEGERSFLD